LAAEDCDAGGLLAIEIGRTDEPPIVGDATDEGRLINGDGAVVDLPPDAPGGVHWKRRRTMSLMIAPASKFSADSAARPGVFIVDLPATRPFERRSNTEPPSELTGLSVSPILRHFPSR
jgi:hypothetical protein